MSSSSAAPVVFPAPTHSPFLIPFSIPYLAAEKRPGHWWVHFAELWVSIYLHKHRNGGNAVLCYPKHIKTT